MNPSEQIEEIYQVAIRHNTTLTIGIPELYQKWISKTFCTEVVAVQPHCFTKHEQADTLVFVNLDTISDAELYEIKKLHNEKKHRHPDFELFCVTEKQLQYYYNNPYWAMCSSWPCINISETDYQEYLAYANQVLKDAGYHLFRDRYMFSFGDLSNTDNIYYVYVQSAVWQDKDGNYFLPIFHEGGFFRGSADIEIMGLHDDIFLTEGFVPIDLSKEDIKKEILSLAT